ncbi:MAG: hypothetical protein JW934_15665 [Anaerolineae bacterium]|nr:hypothetical protein [Anaerolineae bacterium]
MARFDNPIIELEISHDNIPSRKEMVRLLQESSTPIDGLLALYERLHMFEKKYEMRSDEFINRYVHGELSEREEWLQWIGLRHITEILRLRIENALIDEQQTPLSRRPPTL